MKRVLDRNAVAHAWAHQTQDEARVPGGNFYFTGPTVYSYGSHFAIAHFVDALGGRVLINDATPSVTTAKHQYTVRCAMTNQQRAQALHVPGLKQDTAREIDRALAARRLPECTPSLLRAVQAHVAKIIGKRHGSGPFVEALRTAREYDKTARVFYAMTRRRYPLSPVPTDDEIPADKAARAAFVAKFSRAIVQQDYAEALERAKTAADSLKNLDTFAGLRAWEVSEGLTRINAGLRACRDAGGHYATLHAGRISPAIKRLIAVFEAAEKPFAAARDAVRARDAQNEYRDIARGYWRARKPSRRASIGRAGVYHLAEKIEQFPPDGALAPLMARIIRAQSAQECEDRAVRFKGHIESAADYRPKFPGDALQHYAQALSAADHIAHSGAPNGAHILARIAPDVAAARAAVEELRDEVKRANAQRIADWVNGTSNSAPPYGAGTFARINGNTVQTSRSASVPLEHACRLARLYDRIRVRGGQSWPDGSGPMVGHYRVNAIDADGRIVIGCHEFEASEALRVRALLAACPGCVNVAETIEGATTH